MLREIGVIAPRVMTLTHKGDETLAALRTSYPFRVCVVNDNLVKFAPGDIKVFFLAPVTLLL